MENENQGKPTTAVATVERIDNGKPALYNPAAFDQIWRAAKLFASSDLVPKDYKDKPANCFIAIEMADRLGITPFAVLQSLVIIHGKPSMEAKLITALVNDSGMFVDPLEYEIVGDDPYAMDYKVRCFATMKRSGKVCLGPWIDYKMVKGEGWLDKIGSKWKTMPSVMFMYRAASFFAKIYASNITMGMQTEEEMEDVRTPVDITPAPALAGMTLEHKQAPDETLRQKMEAEMDEKLWDQKNQPQKHTPAPAPARKRGEPSPGRKRRTKEEMAEDEAAELAEQQVQKPQTPTCEHPSSRMENGIEVCESCGEILSEDEAPPFPDLTEQATPATERQVNDSLGHGATQQRQAAVQQSDDEPVDLF